jgi:transcriptional regulator of acetoin/glycerol metabolism
MIGPDPWSDIADVRYQRRAMGAWERMVGGDGLVPGAVRDVVERSWMRCIAARVDPGFMHAPDPVPGSVLTALRERNRELIEASAAILTQGRDALSNSGSMMILTDPAGVILETEGDPGTLEAGLDVRLVAGASWDERQSGTNAIGAAVSPAGPCASTEWSTSARASNSGPVRPRRCAIR